MKRVSLVGITHHFDAFAAHDPEICVVGNFSDCTIIEEM